MELQTLIYEKKGPIAYVILHRPDRLNAENHEMQRELVQVFGDIDRDPLVRAVIFTGSGTKAFCAGADLKDPVTHTQANLGDFVAYHGFFFDAIQNCTKPIVCAVHGWAIGAGCQMPLCCDIIIAAENAVFQLPQVQLGIMPAYAGLTRLARLVGKGPAARMGLLCERVNAQEAYRIGLVSEVVPFDQLMPAAEKIAQRLADMPPLAIRMTKEALNMGYDMPLQAAAKADGYRFMGLVGTEDREEGHLAQREKRKPVFKGR